MVIAEATELGIPSVQYTLALRIATYDAKNVRVACMRGVHVLDGS